MGKARLLGAKGRFAPNREADKRRRNKAFFKGQNFVDGEYDRQERKIKKKLREMKEAT